MDIHAPTLWLMHLLAFLDQKCGVLSKAIVCASLLFLETHNVHLTHSIGTLDGFFGFKRQKLDEDTVDPLGSVSPAEKIKKKVGNKERPTTATLGTMQGKEQKDFTTVWQDQEQTIESRRQHFGTTTTRTILEIKGKNVHFADARKIIRTAHKDEVRGLPGPNVEDGMEKPQCEQGPRRSKS
ncbi:hypothetical protein CRE_25861 [Caenorhabditis remanei]|uniref:Uncharacterized protein n=1 Tax=Caenorhabditis remanei TaxID=31234 RepID=E3NDS0_CAERE|nr:hypothetical protein CRE_25861 [Caenorhabditis remanei]